SREYLIGRALDPPTVRGLLAVIQGDSRVVQVRRAESMLIGPEDALLAVRVNFRDGLTTDQLELAIDEVAASVKQRYPVVRHVVIEPES
ncbi:cation efflux protein, partial [mine drainage metagenome]